MSFLGLKIVEINPTELCNRTCSFCPRSLPTVFPNRNLHIEISTVEKLIKDLTYHKFNGRIHITGFGEPLLNPDIVDIIRICSIFDTQLITNGDKLLSNHELYSHIINSGLKNIIVSCYDGKEQVNRVQEFLADCKVAWSIREYTDTGDTYKKYNFTNRGGLMYNVETSNRVCFYPFYKAFIDFDGTVRLCCNDWQRKHNLGNILLDNFYNIWMSNKFLQIRQQLHQGNRCNVLACNKCDINGQQKGGDSYKLWIENDSFKS